ncbi:hypothetical protein NEOKW01_1963 [Nematocida sp. AWRm80]|nr:hypothetical protein NEOKW01_1963 [Nematocida sp. AWRm80]
MKLKDIVCLLGLAKEILSMTYDTCSIVPSAGLSIVKYYRKECVHCQRITPKISKIINSIEKTGMGVTGMMIDTQVCPPEDKGIDAIPTVVVQKNGIELLKFTGDKPYDEIVELVSKAIGMKKSLFEPETKKGPTEILSLTKQDFLSGFTGPWVVYFEGRKDPVIDQILLQTYKTFEGEVKIAKYTGEDKEIVAGRYYIYDFPGILVMYDGILMRYNGDMTLRAFNEFCTRLVEPSFKEASIQELSHLTTPTFVVFYSDLMVANKLFRRIAHDLKMNAQTYKMKIEPTGDETILRLAVFKNGTKFYYDGDINDEGAIREWLFHAHFPNISKLSMDNFYSIFHGLKPVVALITDGGNAKEIREFEEIAEEYNRGTSSSPYVFTFIDTKEYPKFTQTNFGVLHGKPLIVFFDPEKQTFYGGRIKASERIQPYFDRQMKAFASDSLDRYTKEKPFSYKWLLIGGIVIGGIVSLVRIAITSRKKAAFE